MKNKIKLMRGVFKKIHHPIEFNLKSYDLFIDKINNQHFNIRKNTDHQIRRIINQIQSQKNEIEPGEMLVQLFAAIKEICIRCLHLVPTDFQMLGGIALYEGKMVEMQTGEGKTLVAVFAGCLDALRNGNVHILTFNDYLAKRDAEWMLPLYSFIDLSVGYINENMGIDEKNAAYNCDITYAAVKEVGFDFLRSLSSYSPKERIIQHFNTVIVDEADAILIDEARNPLVLAGNLIKANLNLKKIAEFISSLNPNKDYNTDEYRRNVYLTESGIDKAEKHFQIKNLHSDANLELHSAINLSLQARVLLHKGVDYIVKNEEIKLVDELTGRVIKDRKWKNGLQAAVEAKEGISTNSEGSILNSITLPHLMQQYTKISGMTATAQSAADEFNYFYNLKTIVIPPNKTSVRIDYPDLIFRNKDEKYEALIEEVKDVHRCGRPILIGTLTVQESERLSDLIEQSGIQCQVLNAKNDEEEARIIAEAGMMNAVTISTNMAGRGTDIVLGGKDHIRKKEIEKLGGLYVIGTNRHESLRIDRQLRGRAGRQGDPGSTRFFVSLEDDLMIKYNLKEIQPEKPPKNYKPINDISHIQRVIEGQMYDLRRFLYTYSYLIEKQRIILANEREKILENIKTKENLRIAMLLEYDKYWAQHLDYLNELKEGSHLLRIGGLDPVREFQKKADLSFREMIAKLEKRIEFLKEYFKHNPIAVLSNLGLNKPSSTWTYVINDFPFGNALGIMLNQNANIGFQVDILSLFVLFFYRLFKRGVHRNKSDSKDE